jgi:predicted molibdopterin-dependent oxidoreductase YjgC
MTLQTRGDSLVRALPKQTGGPNRGLLCGSGRFGYDYTAHPGRLTTPLVRKNGALEPASWDEALAYTAQRLREVRSRSGSGALAGILSARSTTEDAYAFQKFVRVALGTNNIDSSASLGYAPALRLLEKIFGEGVTANHIHGIANSGGVIVLGGDPTASAPVLGLQVRAAFRKGLPVVLFGQAPGLRYFTSHRLPALPRSEAAVLAACLTEMKKSPPSDGRHALDDLVARLPEISPAEAAEVSALTEDAIRSAAGAMSAMTAPSLIIGKSLIQCSEGAAALLFAATLAHVTNGKIYLVPDEPNAQGVLDVGCHPDVLPCGRPAAVETYRRQCEDILGSPLPSVPGLGYGAIIEAAGRREIRAVYAMGEDILKSLPDPAYARQALESLDFLVVHDDFLTETAALAHVVFPSLSWTEKDGSYTNLERRVQFSRQAVRRQGFPEWETLSLLSSLLGHPLGYTCRADITAEIARVSAVYRNMTPADIECGTWLWPYKGMPLRHDARQAGIRVPERAELLSLPTGQRPVAFPVPVLFHSGRLSCYSPAMTSIAPFPSVRIGLSLAERTGIRNGALVTIRSERGSITARAALDASVPDGVVFIPDRSDRGCNALSTVKFAETGALALDGDGVTLSLSEADGGG